MTDEYERTFLGYLCERERGVRLLFTVSVAGLALSLVWLAVLEPGTPTFVVTVMNVVGLAVLALGSGVVVAHCD